MLKDPFAMLSRSPSSARSSRALYAPRLKPLAQAIALLLVAGGAQAAGQPFSAAWFAAKGAAQGGAAGAPRPGAQLPGRRRRWRSSSGSTSSCSVRWPT